MSYTSARAQLARTMDRVCQDHEVVVITRQRAEPVVMMSLGDYESLTETAYLLQTAANNQRLLDALQDLKAGRGRKLEIVDGRLVEPSGRGGSAPLGSE
ncbi:MAG: type II toxin-antitoxin system prevent-host-death family antitoxin [Fimbriimonadaceae bacterium]|nr:type II toxin-antitoxin system prevent-host-death family antitoxin [Fimbriimonadaceae bacterium]